MYVDYRKVNGLLYVASPRGLLPSLLKL